MPLDTSVKFFHSAMPEMSVFTGLWQASQTPTVGTAAAAAFANLSKVFVEGFNSKTVSTLSVSNGVATVNFSSSHGFDDYSVILVSGATPAELNGEKRISLVSGTSVTFDATGVLDGTATGTITAKYAPLGWSYVGATPTALPMTIRSVDPNGTALGVKFDAPSTGGTIYPIQMTGYRVANASTVSSQFGGTKYAPVWNGTQPSISSTQWVIVGDSRTFYILVNSAQNANLTASNIGGHLFGAGEFQPLAPLDAYRSFLCGSDSTVANGSTTTSSLHYNDSAVHPGLVLAGTTGGGAVSAVYSMMEFGFGATAVVPGATASPVAPSYPNSADSSLILCKKLVADQASCRGWFRGLYQSPQACASAFSPLEKIDGQGALNGRKLLALRTGSYYYTGATTVIGTGATFFDITGPWA